MRTQGDDGPGSLVVGAHTGSAWAAGRVTSLVDLVREAWARRFNGVMRPAWVLRRAGSDDGDWIAELRATALRADLERLGRWDPVNVRRRFLDGFRPACTWIIDVGGEPIGSVAVRPERDAVWIEHFYLDPAHQGRGIGSDVLQHVIAAHRDLRPFRLNVLQGSPARRLYERHGFVVEHEDPIDVFLVLGRTGASCGGAR